MLKKSNAEWRKKGAVMRYEMSDDLHIRSLSDFGNRSEHGGRASQYFSNFDANSGAI